MFSPVTFNDKMAVWIYSSALTMTVRSAFGLLLPWKQTHISKYTVINDSPIQSLRLFSFVEEIFIIVTKGRWWECYCWRVAHELCGTKTVHGKEYICLRKVSFRPCLDRNTSWTVWCEYWTTTDRFLPSMSSIGNVLDYIKRDVLFFCPSLMQYVGWQLTISLLLNFHTSENIRK